MVKVGDVGTLKELGVDVGDVVERISWPDGDYVWVGHKYLIERIMGSIKACNQNEIGSTTSIECDPGEFRLISRAKDNPKLWRDMTPEEKGALLLAAHDGSVIEWSYGLPWVTINSTATSIVSWSDECAYRIKLGPKVETVTLYGGDTKGNNSRWGFSVKNLGPETNRITFNLIDGKPDCTSIKMEEL